MFFIEYKCLWHYLQPLNTFFQTIQADSILLMTFEKQLENIHEATSYRAT